MSDDDLFLRVAALKVMSDFTAARYKEAREEVEEILTPGDRRMVRSPLDNSKIGPVSMTDPKPVCEVTDERLLRAWMAGHYPETVETGYEIGGAPSEVVAVLFEHAPHLLRSYTRVKTEAMRELRADAIGLGHPVGPGGEADIPGLTVRVPPAVVRCAPDDGALLAVMELHGSGRLALDGTTRPALEAS